MRAVSVTSVYQSRHIGRGTALEAVLVCLRVAAGVSLVFLVPGLPWSYALLARHRRSLLETLGVSVALSIALVPLGLFLLNLLLGVPIDVVTTVGLLIALALMGTLAALWRTSFHVRLLSPGLGFSGRLRRPMPV